VKKRWTAPVLGAVGVALALSACGGGSAPSAGGKEKNELTVWLMNGSVPDTIVKEVNADLAKQHPGAKVTVQTQEWNGIQDKLTTALASNNPPDVIEMGNTQNAKFSASGALRDLTPVKAKLGADQWPAGMASAGQWNGKTYGAPMLAANRVVIYRKDLFAQAGIAVPKTFAEWLAATKKLNEVNARTKNFQGIYLPGQSWYFYAGLLWDAGGDFATKDGNKWKGALDTPAAAQAMSEYAQLQALSKAPKDADEATPQQFEVFKEGNVAQMIGLPWEMGSAVGANAKLKDKVGVFAIPGQTADKSASVFLGGSNLGVAAGSDSPKLATDWVTLMTGEKYQLELAKASGVVPNRTSLLPQLTDPTLQVMAGAAANGRVTPVDPRWAAVEAGANPIKDFMTSVLTGTDPASAGAKASQEITSRMSGAL
jgi:N,N'-diacetylchitobiose transport system substrate-binding protein